MSKVRIVTDSTADLPADVVKRYGITVVPLKVFIGREVFLDGVEITPDEFFRRQTAGEMSTTSQPSPAEFVDYYRPYIDAGDEIISIHISSLMSGTVQSATLARTMLEYPGLVVVDSGVVSIALGIMVLNVARAAEAGKGRDELLAMIDRMRSRMRVYFMVDTLEYLQRGGRIGRAQAFLGTLLNVKPILTLQDGLVHPLEKVRGRSKACGRLIALMRETYGAGSRLQCWITHGVFPEGLEMVRQGLIESFDCTEILTGRLGPVVGTHGGPGLVGVVCLPVEE
ncbi:MAG: DegV family protein [Peptococcaceae bacterium]|nr:DegV family protein [Peptococcaceae bacterium]